MNRIIFKLLFSFFSITVILYIFKISTYSPPKLPYILEESAKIPVFFHGKPSFSQESIDIAMKAFSINVAKEDFWPLMDLSQDDRGVTYPGSILNKPQVFVGPEAFISWGILGSTLAHDIEIHCQQNVYLIVFKDLLGFDGTGDAEREAYSHEIFYKNRFHLTDREVVDIRDIMTQHYPSLKWPILSSK